MARTNLRENLFSLEDNLAELKRIKGRKSAVLIEMIQDVEIAIYILTTELQEITDEKQAS